MGSGYNYVTPSFTDIGLNTYTLGGIVLSGDDVEDLGDNLQLFDSMGNCGYQFYWFDGSWFDMDGYLEGDDPNEYVIDRGTFPVIDIQNTGDVKSTVAGEVNMDGVTFKAGAGYNYVGNATQAVLSLGDIELSGDDVEDLGDNLQIFDSMGNCGYQFYWFSGSWFDMDEYLEGDDPNEYPINPGEGVVIDIQNDGDVTIAVSGKPIK